ncbi:MAG: hypothetical protein O7D91_17725 [Planctomycetota bacterium]|nr:hypothetical protein [Planctomycetota bacterium]
MKTIIATGDEWKLFVEVCESERDGLPEVLLRVSTAEGSTFEFVGLLCRQFMTGSDPSESTEAAGKALLGMV